MGTGTVLVIDDERDLVDLVRRALEREGLQVLGASDGESGLALAQSRLPDLILLDRMMPGPDGLALCRRLRQDERTARVPVVFLTAKAAEEDRVEGLDAGADDYVTKPFSVRELVARVRARLRKGPDVPAMVQNGDLVINESRGEATFGGRPLALSAAELRMLQFMAAVPGRVMFRRSAPPGELLFGTLARRQGAVTPAQLREALAAQERDPSRRIGDLLVERFVLAPRDLERLLERQRQAFDGVLGRILVGRKLATEFQVRDALRLQGRMVEAKLLPVARLGEILVKRGVLTASALLAALELQSFMLYRCPPCGERIPLHPEAGREAVICPKCRQEIPPLFAKMAVALHRVLDEAAVAQAVEVPPEVFEAANRPDREFGKYVLVREAGRGGSGVVWRAWQRDRNRWAAVKILNSPPAEGEEGRTPFGHAESVKRFFSEARAVSELDHPHIVPLWDYGVVDRSFYCAMPFVEGASLDAMLHGPPDEEDVLPARRIPLKLGLTAVRDVARALDYAHGRGVCHRDVKPGNILIDGDSKAWLIDFGLARVAAMGDPAYRRGVVVGTPYYMPPEQASGDMERVDAKSDTYSLGAVLYEILSRRYPYAGLDSEAVFGALPVREPEPISLIAPDLPPALQRIVTRAMARDRKDRYGRASRMADDLDSVLNSME